MRTPERRVYAVGVGTDVVLGVEATTRSTTDSGNLLGKSVSTVGVAAQRRNPVVTDPRLRGSRVGRQPGSGSYWVPARIDLDTTLSKIDSRLLSDVIAIKGPYAARYGPGFSHVDFQLLASPRYADGFEVHGATSFDYKTNGQQWYGRQTLQGGAADWGFRGSYGHRTGNDYVTGEGTEIPASYNSRDVNLALGRDFSGTSHVEFNYLRLDQTGVELPGQAFDIDDLATDGYDVKYVLEDQPRFDRLDVEAWYNSTRFHGSAQNAGKHRQFPFYDAFGFVGVTDVDSTSTGFRIAGSWGCADCEQLSIGVDLRFLKQGLNEITSSPVLGWVDANSPIPKSDFSNPGVFVEYRARLTDEWKVAAGARADYATAEITDDPARLAALGTSALPLADILGTDNFGQDYELLAAYLTGQYEINCCWTVEAAVGYAERPPSLTELYAAESFMFVLQNGLNTVTGDPLLNKERLCQVDLGLRLDNGWLRGRLGGFYAWAWDYITFENLVTLVAVPQVQLKYVNTDLATFAGTELYSECDLTDWLTPFGTLSYVEGRDRTRNGDFATAPAAPGVPSSRVLGLPRGANSGIAGGDEEPLPGISPLESRLGVRLHPAGDLSQWCIELAARLVARQDRVATSLLETPTPAFTVWDVRGYWRPRERLLLVAGIENFTDQNYREHLDFRAANGIQVFQPGANLYTGCEWIY
jgi:outer membrane receptor protein involved in Fe transport